MRRYALLITLVSLVASPAAAQTIDAGRGPLLSAIASAEEALLYGPFKHLL